MHCIAMSTNKLESGEVEVFHMMPEDLFETYISMSKADFIQWRREYAEAYEGIDHAWDDERVWPRDPKVYQAQELASQLKLEVVRTQLREAGKL